VMKNLKKRASSHEYRFLKALFTLSRCRIAEYDNFGDLFSRSRMHVDERDKVSFAAQQRRRRKPRCIGGSWLFVVTRSVAASRIDREGLPRITMSHNRLGLSLLKHIRRGLIAKINSKKRMQTCEAMDQILTDYSRKCRAPMPAPIASPRHATSRNGEVSERTLMFLSFYSFPHTCKCTESNPPFK
jgi:hypothetical protein